MEVKESRSATKTKDDCFQQVGFSSPSNERNRRLKQKTSKTNPETTETSVSEQPAHLVEEIDAMTALILYHNYSKKHEYTFSAQHRVSDSIDQGNGK